MQLLRKVVKPLNNQTAKHLVDNECKICIQNSDIICIYGMSLGETDQTWWKHIGQLITDYDKKLIIFWKDNSNSMIPSVFSDLRLDKVDEIKELFATRAQLNDTQKKAVWDKIYVVYNEDRMLKLPEKK